MEVAHETLRVAGGGPVAAPHRAEGHAEDLVEVGRHPRAQRLRPRPPPRTAATVGCGLYLLFFARPPFLTLVRGTPLPNTVARLRLVGAERLPPLSTGDLGFRLVCIRFSGLVPAWYHGV